MNLRLKLLISFSLSAFCALFLFGFVAYDTALEESEKNESRLIFNILKDEINIVSNILKNTADFSSAISELNHSHNLLFHVVDDQDRPVYSSDELNKYVQTDLIAITQGKETQGQFEIDETEFHWQKLAIENTPYSATVYYTHDEEVGSSFLMQMALSLAVTAFVVIWVAAWSALYIASLLEKLNNQKSELEKLATHDNLTGLPNRRLLLDRIEQSIELSNREKQKFALFFLDLNKFKEINDNLGHKYGDLVLQQLAERLKKSVRKSDTVARLGGDELAIVFNKSDRAAAHTIAEKIISIIETPMLLDNKEHQISASIGIAIFPDNATCADDLIVKADQAMYVAKKSGVHCRHFDDIELEGNTKTPTIQIDWISSQSTPVT